MRNDVDFGMAWIKTMTGGNPLHNRHASNINKYVLQNMYVPLSASEDEYHTHTHTSTPTLSHSLHYSAVFYKHNFTRGLFRALKYCVKSQDSISWWRHQMEPFFALLALCAGKSPVTGEFSAQRSVTRSFDVFFDVRLNKWLSKQSRGWCFDTPPSSLWRHCNVEKQTQRNSS